MRIKLDPAEESSFIARTTEIGHGQVYKPPHAFGAKNFQIGRFSMPGWKPNQPGSLFASLDR